VLSTGDPAAFHEHAPRFLGEELPHVGYMAEELGRLTHRTTMEIVTGQIMR
jgi:hypothetical protein